MKLPKAPYALCDKCPFKDRSFSRTTGPEDAKIAVVSRSPGHFESLAGKSFSGPAGRVLDHLLQLHGVKRDEVLATNVVLCKSDGNEKGFGLAQACCAPRLESEIGEADTVIAAGREAAWGVIGEANIGMNRGYVHHRDSEAGKDQRVIVTNNPAVVVRDDATFPELVRDFRLAISPLPTPKLPKVSWTEDLDEAKRWADEMFDTISGGTNTLVAVDIEGGYSGLACIGFAIRPERAVTFGIGPCSDETFRREYIGKLLTIEDVRYLWQFGKYDTKELKKFGIAARVDEDTGLLSYALDERPGDPESGAGGHSLEWLLKDELGWPKYEPGSVRDFKKGKGAWSDWPTTLPDKRTRIDLYEYNGMDTAGSLALYHVLRERAVHDNVYDRPYKATLIPLSNALTEVESYGNLWDIDAACDILETEVWPRLHEWKGVLREIAREDELNPNSPKQLVELLYDKWGLQHDLDRPRVERNPMRADPRAVDADVRQEIIRDKFRLRNGVNRNGVKAFAETLDRWKALDKQRNTYIEPFTIRAEKSPDGRIYTIFNIHGTESARLSSKNPNMQNVTRPKEGLPNIRRVFVADPGCQFISADLSQAELRTIAVLSGDTELQAIYLDTNRSLHKEVASQFYGEGYTYEQYVRAKNINFGVAYGQSAFTFAQMYHMPQEEAQAYIDFWWGRFPKVKEWRKLVEQQMLEKGELQSPFGHKRRFYIIPQEKKAYIHAVNQAISFEPQNIAANITLFAVIRLVNELLNPEVAQVRITVHDSIVVCAREDHISETAQVMKETIESSARDSIGWDFPYKADISVGPTWGDLKETE